MLSNNERFAKLEEEITAIKHSLYGAGALPIIALQAALDQMVDEQLLPAATRTEIWGRIRTDLKVFTGTYGEIGRGAERAIPHYLTKSERAAFKQRDLRLQKEILQLREPKPGDDQ